MDGVPRHQSALGDFEEALRKAALQAIWSRLTGKSTRLLSYNDVRSRLDGLEQPYRELKDIPLDAIIGTVNRYDDFTRTLLPLKGDDEARWTSVRMGAEGGSGLPPIEVYQVGEAYFILDGHHRASVAREIGTTHIQAYVRQVLTRVPVTPNDQIEDILLKGEYINFLKQTQLDELRPDAVFQVTEPGQYDRLLELIGLHRYDLILDQGRPISMPDAAIDWYDTIYLPVLNAIRDRNLLRDFPGRTEADLYLWMIEHSQRLEKELGWQVEPETVGADLKKQERRSLLNLVKRGVSRVFRQRKPRSPESFFSHEPLWKHKKVIPQERSSLFSHILVLIPAEPSSWQVVEMACMIASREKGFIGGLHAQMTEHRVDENQLKTAFAQICETHQVEGSLAVVAGSEDQALLARSYWADLIVIGLERRRPINLLQRLPLLARRLLEKGSVPLLFHHNKTGTHIQSILLAYDGNAHSDQALYLAAYLALSWHLALTVLTFGGDPARQHTQEYLGVYDDLDVKFLQGEGDVTAIAPIEAEANQCDAILIGGFKTNQMKERIFGSTIERLVRSTNRPVFYCP